MAQPNQCRFFIRVSLPIFVFFGLCSITLGQVFASERLEVVDDLGNQVMLESPAVRIVSLAPHLTEILFELGVGDNVIATVSYADFPEEAKLIPRGCDATRHHIRLGERRR